MRCWLLSAANAFPQLKFVKVKSAWRDPTIAALGQAAGKLNTLLAEEYLYDEGSSNAIILSEQVGVVAGVVGAGQA